MDYTLLLAVGGLAGVLSALLGIGGGLVLVPALSMVLASRIPEGELMKTAVATSLATIPFTGGWAAYQQHLRGFVDGTKVRTLAFGVVAGALLGSGTATLVSDTLLRGVFCVFALYVGIQMILGKQPRFRVAWTTRSANVAGALTGLLSSWVGIGGGTVVVPYLLSTGESPRHATGISSAVGVVVALSACVGYALAAYGRDIHLPFQVGYVHVPATINIVVGSLIGVLLGMRIVERINASLLKKLFAVTLLLAGTKMAASLVG